MTEEQWFDSTDPAVMLVHVQEALKAAQTVRGMRRLRLVACAACRLTWDRLPDPDCRGAVEASERYAEGLIGRKELDAAREKLRQAFDRLGLGGAAYRAYRAAGWCSASAGLESVNYAVRHTTTEGLAPSEDPLRRRLAGLTRDIFGNPFRPVPLDRSALTPDVATLAQAAYEHRELPSGHLEPARLAVLSDALEEAGVTGEILDHLRSPGPHVRGCWAVDLVMGKG